MEAELHDGTILEFPDGTDASVVQATVKKVIAQKKAIPTPGAQQQPVAPQEGLVSQFVRGVSELPRTVLEVPTALASGLVAPVIGSAYALGRQALEGKIGSPAGALEAANRAAETSNALTYEPRTAAGKTIVGGVNSALSAVAPAFPAMLGGEMQALSPRPVMDAIRNRAEAPNPPSIRPEVAAAADKFQRMGGKVLPHTLSENKIVRMTGDWVENLPLSGSPNAANKLVINRELLRQIGGDEKAGLLTPSSFAPAMDKAGKTIGEMYGKVTVPYDSGLNSALDAIIKRQRKQTPDIEKQVNAYVDDIRTVALNNKNSIPGSTLRELDTELGTRIRSTTDGDLKGQLSDIQEVLRDSLESRLPPSDAAILQDARIKYAKGKLLEPLVAKNNLDGVPPSQLLSRQLATNGGRHRLATEAAGEMGDLAIIGNKFMNDTSTKYRGVIGSIGSAVMAVPGVIAGNAYNRIGPVISKNRVAEAMKTREGLGYPSAQKAPAVSLEFGDQAWRSESPFQTPAPQDSGLLSLGNTPEQPSGPNLSMGVIEWPRSEPQVGITKAQEYQAAMRRDAIAETRQRLAEEANKQPTGRGIALELAPNGKLRPADQGMKGATPDVIASTGHELNSAVGKISQGFNAGLTTTERIAWNKAKVDIATVAPSMRGLTDSQIAGKMMDRQWVADAVKKAQEKARGFDEISKRAKDAETIRRAVAERERMLDLAESLDESLRGGRAIISDTQGPKTRRAILEQNQGISQ